MGFSDRKLEIAITGLATVMMVGLGYLLKTPVQAVLGGSESDIVYEMPRPKTSFFAALFNLGDREVDRKYVNPFAKKKAKEEKKPVSTAKIGIKVPPKAVVQQKQAKKKSDEDQKKKVDVQIVGDDSSKPIGEDSFWNESGPAQQHSANNDKRGPPPPSDLQDKKNTMDGNQWRSLLMAQPTKENVNKLIEAYNSKEVDDQTFYTIVTDLFRNNKPEVQSYGLSAVKSAYNVKSFTLTSQYYDQLAPEVQQQAHAYLLSYGVGGRLSILLTALQSSDAEVVSTAAQVVMEGHRKAKDGGNSVTDPRASRGDVMVNTVSSYAKFVPVLQQLARSQDTNIASLATNVLNEIQSTVAAL